MVAVKKRTGKQRTQLVNADLSLSMNPLNFLPLISHSEASRHYRSRRRGWPGKLPMLPARKLRGLKESAG